MVSQPVTDNNYVSNRHDRQQQPSPSRKSLEYLICTRKKTQKSTKKVHNHNINNMENDYNKIPKPQLGKKRKKRKKEEESSDRRFPPCSHHATGRSPVKSPLAQRSPDFYNRNEGISWGAAMPDVKIEIIHFLCFLDSCDAWQRITVKADMCIRRSFLAAARTTNLSLVEISGEVRWRQATARRKRRGRGAAE
ncbi:hypothetical protein L484_016793 [Morus notabilis]|uniref:Uncharacterized protein n=1 Tax=Morus notabilis TaxID=981085 RepID=W9S4G8_9ROSA|nr:hypothetical protein L484_016793 [Morus notabilis]